MALTRSISWTAALRDMRADRAVIASADRRAHAAAAGFARIAERRARGSALVIAGRYDRAAIMRVAVTAARARRAVTGEAWALCLSAALRGTWAAAKAARLATAH
ncbi:hypothetical protein [Methylobacterium oxalidis]|uniref:hypothetical protein n=1 Tax=Methylobacterium oxalidis TaxID=944322 RepID=UPI003315AFFF